MNDEFLTRLRKSPRPEFAAALYQRISKPMDIQQRLLAQRRMVLAFSALAAALVITLAAAPNTRAFANDLWRQIGAFLLYNDAASLSPAAGPTVEPAPELEMQLAASASEAGRAAGFAVYAPAHLPAGYALAGQWGILPQGQGVIVTSHYTNAEHHFLHLDQFKPGPGDLHEQSLEASQTVIVRGRQGVWNTGRLFRNSAGTFITTNWLMWEENGINYTLYSDGLTLEETLKVADGLTQ